MNDMQNFSNLKNRAINEMLEMNERAAKTGHSNVEFQEKTKQVPHKIHTENTSVCFSNDEILILGIVFILSKDCSDYWLFLALLYILM